MDPTILAAVISGSVAFVNVLVVAYLYRIQAKKLEREIAHWDYEERMRFPLSEALRARVGPAETPNTFDLEYRLEKETLVEQWRKALAERALDSDSKQLLFRQKAQDYQKKADSLWNSSIRSDRYRSALFYVLAAEAAVLGGDFVEGGSFYHYAAMIWRTLEEWDRSGGYYCLSAKCHRIIDTYLELKKARRSLTRAMASYYAGLNYEGYEMAKAEYQEVIGILESKFGWSYVPEQMEELEELLEQRGEC